MVIGPIDSSYELEMCNHATAGHYGATVCAGHVIRGRYNNGSSVASRKIGI